MDIYLIDGTYELFRYFYAVPSAKDTCGQEIGAVRGVLASVLSMIEGGATHVGVATDHVIESFRNDLYLGYKTSEGVDPALLSQFPILEEAPKILDKQASHFPFTRMAHLPYFSSCNPWPSIAMKRLFKDSANVGCAKMPSRITV